MTGIGKRLKSLREKHQLKQNEAANLLGISKANLSRYESENRTPGTDMIEKLAKFYQVTPAYLMFGDNEHTDFLKDITKEEANLLKQYLKKIRSEKK